MPITYCIFCNISGEKYYGSTTQSLNKRISSHKSNLNCTSKQIILRGDYDIYTLGNYDTIEEAMMKEKWYIDNKDCINKRRVCITEEERKKQRKKYNNYYREKNYEKIIHDHNKKVQCEFCKEYSSNSHLARHKGSIKCKKFQ